MRQTIGSAALFVTLVVRGADGQAARSRSRDYLFAATASDVRAVWLNPAGLAVIPSASVMAEFSLDRPVSGNVRLAQWSLGFSNRGLSVAYQRDRFDQGPSTGALRLGIGLPFRRGAAGLALSFYQGSAVADETHRSLDLGFRYRLLPSVEVGAVVRDIGRPVPRNSVSPVSGALSVGWIALPQRAFVAVEAVATERLAGVSGYDMAYRGGLQFSTGGRLPFTATGTLELDGDLAIRTWTVGVALGGRDRAIALGSGSTGPTRLDRMSLTGVVSRAFPSRPR